jgi:glycogen debranching enzyme
MTIPAGSGFPSKALVVDLAVWERLAPEDRRRARDRLMTNRSDVLVVEAGPAGWDTDLEGDYRVSDDGGTVLRLPSREPVVAWEGYDPSLAAAVDHLAGEFLIMPSSVGILIDPSRPLPGADPSWAVEAVAADDPDGLIAAVDRFLAGPAVSADLCDEAFDQALKSIRRNITPLGFTAASLADNPLGLEDANYASVWARDGVMTGLWTLGLDDAELVEAFAATLRLLARHQAPSGQIPAYVLINEERPDYSGIGGIASIDSVLWFVIGAARFAFHQGDRPFAEEMRHPIERAMAWLAAHDSNNDGLLEIPESSDWMDLFPRSYNVLYDEVLWYRACLDTADLLDALGGEGEDWRREGQLVGRRIIDLFWPTAQQLMDLAGSTSGRFSFGEARYLLSQMTPFDFSWRCDVLANLLAGLHGLLDERKQGRLFDFLWGVGVNQPYPATCLYPPVSSGADDWKDYFLVNFMNLPHHYHNGGIWPFIGGLWVRFLNHLGRPELAHRELEALAETCRQGLRGEWEFNEWLHGLTGRPMGKAHQAWSAASYLQAYLEVHRTSPSPDVMTLDPDRLR